MSRRHDARTRALRAEAREIGTALADVARLLALLDAGLSRLASVPATTGAARIDARLDKALDLAAGLEEAAFQIGLLGLNAGVEAIRAGDAGSGLGTVASDLRGAAERVTALAQDLGRELADARGEASEGAAAKLAPEAAAALAGLERTSMAIAAHLAEAAAAQRGLMAEIQVAAGAKVETDLHGKPLGQRAGGTPARHMPGPDHAAESDREPRFVRQPAAMAG